jgi:hypothetical protein
MVAMELGQVVEAYYAQHGSDGALGGREQATGQQNLRMIPDACREELAKRGHDPLDGRRERRHGQHSGQDASELTRSTTGRSNG